MDRFAQRALLVLGPRAPRPRRSKSRSRPPGGAPGDGAGGGAGPKRCVVGARPWLFGIGRFCGKGGGGGLFVPAPRRSSPSKFMFCALACSPTPRYQVSKFGRPVWEEDTDRAAGRSALVFLDLRTGRSGSAALLPPAELVSRLSALFVRDCQAVCLAPRFGLLTTCPPSLLFSPPCFFQETRSCLRSAQDAGCGAGRECDRGCGGLCGKWRLRAHQALEVSTAPLFTSSALWDLKRGPFVT